LNQLNSMTIRIQHTKEESRFAKLFPSFLAFYFALDADNEKIKKFGWDMFFGGFGFSNLAYAPIFIIVGGEKLTFQNTEAGFQYLKYLYLDKDKEIYKRFAKCNGQEAWDVRCDLMNNRPDLIPDFTYYGYGRWGAMLELLRCKFTQNEHLRFELLATGDAFLMEHNTKTGKDLYFSNNHVGDGLNWLGYQLMIVRAELNGNTFFPKWLSTHINMTTGESLAKDDEKCFLKEAVRYFTVEEVHVLFPPL